jgi:hypothetical protein
MINEKLEMPFRPSNNYCSQQNPPDFSWPYAGDGMLYDIIICRDKNLKEIEYKKDNLCTNFYNFSYTFKPGIYYWSVRCKTDERCGDWEKSRRFLLSPDAFPFPVPDIETLMSRVNAKHPHIYTNAQEIKEFRKEMLSKSNRYFPVLERIVMDFMTREFPTEESCDALHATPETMYGLFANAAANTKLACNMVMLSAFYYLITEDEVVGRFAVENLMKLSAWAPDGVTNYSINDQAHRRIALNSALAYDWLYNLLNETQRKNVLEMIRARTQIMFKSEHYNVSMIAKNPFNSHGWTAIGYVCQIALALYNDLEEAQTWLKYTLPLYINRMHPWSNEDGGWSQGTYYWAPSAISAKKICEALRSSGVIDLYKKAWQQNEFKFPLYFHPEGSIGAFGDNSYLYPSSKDVSAITTLAKRIDIPELKWLRQQWNYLTAYGHTDDPDPSTCIYDREYPDKEAYLPEEIPQDIYMKDIGWIAMHSDISDPQRISLFFKSSEYGSFNHSHADQNSFIIQAYGQPLAIDSGYYDCYGFPFDVEYTRQTHAHNAITHSNGKGQPIFDIMAKGRIMDFLPGKSFALSGGDATASYKGALGKAIRHIIFIKPDMFIIIDDLETGQSDKTTFEFWLNAQKDIRISDEGIEIIKDTAALDMEVDYPENIKVFKSDDFCGTDQIPHYPIYEGHERWPVQKRMWIQTEETDRTKIITALKVRPSNQASKQIDVKKNNDYITYTVDSKTTIYVNKNTNTDNTIGICNDNDIRNVSYAGTAAIVSNDSFMLVNGTKLCINGIALIRSDKPVSVSFDKNELSISSIKEDSVIDILLHDDMVITNEKGREVNENSMLLGLTAVKNGEYTRFSVYNGTYTLNLSK